MIHVGYYYNIKIHADEETGLLYLSKDRELKLAGVVLRECLEYPKDTLINNTIYMGELNDKTHYAHIKPEDDSLVYFSESTGYKPIVYHLEFTDELSKIPLAENPHKNCSSNYIYNYRNGEDAGIRIVTDKFIGFAKTCIDCSTLDEIRNCPSSPEIRKFEGMPFHWYDAFITACEAEGFYMRPAKIYKPSKNYAAELM